MAEVVEAFVVGHWAVSRKITDTYDKADNKCYRRGGYRGGIWIPH